MGRVVSILSNPLGVWKILMFGASFRFPINITESNPPCRICFYFRRYNYCVATIKKNLLIRLWLKKVSEFVRKTICFIRNGGGVLQCTNSLEEDWGK